MGRAFLVMTVVETFSESNIFMLLSLLSQYYLAALF